MLDRAQSRARCIVNWTAPNTHSVIPARSKRQVMDWSLVLASQAIASTIIQADDSTWGLLVEAGDLERAQESIRLYRQENRLWHWKQPTPWTEAPFHWGVLGWCFLIIWIHWITVFGFHPFREAGQFDTRLFARGEWWRAFTAVWLHADLAHLLANATIGFVFIGFSMARYGAGLALLAAFVAGAAGNLAGFLLYPKDYFGMGASGMVMGALGMIAVPPRSNWSIHPLAIRQMLQAAMSTVLLFVLLGVDPRSDIIAHLGGFVAGISAGLLLNLAAPTVTQHRGTLAISWLVMGALFFGTILLACRRL